MSKRQIRKMFELMASGEAVELTSRMSSVKKLARLAFFAEQFGYQYADARTSGGQDSAIKMLIVPDLTPQGRDRAGRSWAQYPQAGGGGPLPPFDPAALELLKARINFDLTGKGAEKRMMYGAVGITVGSVLATVQANSDVQPFTLGFWAFAMALLGVGFLVTRKRNAKFAARLQQAGFAPVTDETGRTRFLPPGGQLPGHGNPFGDGMGQQQGGNPFAGGPQPTAGNPFAGAPQPAGQNPFAGQAQQQPYEQQYAQPAPQQAPQPQPQAPQPPAPVPHAEQTMAFRMPSTGSGQPGVDPTGGHPGGAPAGGAPTMAFRPQQQPPQDAQAQPQPPYGHQPQAPHQPQPPQQYPQPPQS